MAEELWPQWGHGVELVCDGLEACQPHQCFCCVGARDCSGALRDLAIVVSRLSSDELNAP